MLSLSGPTKAKNESVVRLCVKSDGIARWQELSNVSTHLRQEATLKIEINSQKTNSSLFFFTSRKSKSGANDSLCSHISNL